MKNTDRVRRRRRCWGSERRSQMTITSCKYWLTWLRRMMTLSNKMKICYLKQAPGRRKRQALRCPKERNNNRTISNTILTDIRTILIALEDSLPHCSLLMYDLRCNCRWWEEKGHLGILTTHLIHTLSLLIAHIMEGMGRAVQVEVWLGLLWCIILFRLLLITPIM